MKNIKLHAIILALIIVSELIGSYPEVRYRSYRIVADAVRSAFGYFDNT